MSANPYVSSKYANVEGFLELLGYTDAQIKGLTEQQRNKFQTWILEGQNNVEADIADVNPTIEITEDTPAFTFARNAVLNWALYKKRSKDGSKTKDDAKADYYKDIERLRRVLTKERGTRVKNVAIKGASQKNSNILLPSQLDTAFYNNI